VIPSLPGYGFSGPLTETGLDRMVAPPPRWWSLWPGSGYDRYGVQGGGRGARSSARWWAAPAPDRVIGVHVNALVTFPSGDPADMAALTEAETRPGSARWMEQFQQRSGGVPAGPGATRPQTIGQSLVDSPSGLLGLDRGQVPGLDQPGGPCCPRDAVDRDRILTDVSVYWFTATAGSAAHTYYERFNDRPCGCRRSVRRYRPEVAVFPTDISIRRFADKVNNVVRWSEFDRGGHFRRPRGSRSPDRRRARSSSGPSPDQPAPRQGHPRPPPRVVRGWPP